MQQVIFKDLGIIDYKEAWDLQEKTFAKIIDQKIKNRSLPVEDQIQTQSYLYFCEHPHVYTLGKSGSVENLLVDEKELKEIKASYYKINRGGDITYHGPGQLVGYPVLDLDNFFTDIHKYLRYLEEAIILTLKDYGIEAGRFPGYTGVWIEPEDDYKARKICAMGVRCSRWVTMHGWAFNVNSDLSYFNHIIPCGIKDKDVTSMQREMGKYVEMEEVKEKLKFHFASLFEITLV